jgi:DNA-binding NtrC family response regulator
MAMTLQPHIFPNEAFPNEALSNGVSAGVSENDQPRRRTILLVEDEPFVREATCSILESAGFEVLSAKDARDAMKIYEELEKDFEKTPEQKSQQKSGRRIDLVMTDMVLPGRSGEQLGHDLHERSPEVMVLVTSGYGNPEYETEAPESHTYFLAKPYSRRTLVDKIEKILGAPLSARATQAG